MDEEIRMILKMVEEGKITADQAAELIEAIHAREDADSGEDSGSRGLDGVLRDLDRFGEKVKDQIRGSELRTTIKDAVARAMSQVERHLENLGGILGSRGEFCGHNSHSNSHGPEARKDYEGTFDPGDGPIPVQLSTMNGRIRVEEWDKPGYRVTVVARVGSVVTGGGDDAFDELIERVTAGRSLSFRVRRDGFRNRCISFVVSLPRGLVYEPQLGSSNGAIEARGIECSKMEAATSNGRIELNDIKARDLMAATSNGAVFVRGPVAQARCATSNGSITIIPFSVKGESRYEATTSNGSVKIELPTGGGLAYSVHAKTTNGRISVELPDPVYEINDRHTSHHEVLVRNKSFDELQDRVIVQATTSNGSISVGSGLIG